MQKSRQTIRTVVRQADTDAILRSFLAWGNRCETEHVLKVYSCKRGIGVDITVRMLGRLYRLRGKSGRLHIDVSGRVDPRIFDLRGTYKMKR